MSQRDDQWGDEDEQVVRRLRDGKPRISAFELDRIKTTVMARVRPGRARRTAPRSRLLVAFLTVGLMVAGTAGTIAASNTSFSGSTGAAQSQYRPPKCNPMHEECKCPGGSVHTARNQCTCPPGESFGEGTNDCLCPNGNKPTEARKCDTCPPGATVNNDGRCVCHDGATYKDGRCVCPDHGSVVDGKCRHDYPPPTTTSGTTTQPPTPGTTRTTKSTVRTKARSRRAAVRKTAHSRKRS